MLMLSAHFVYGQIDTASYQYLDSTQYALEAMKEQRKKWGPNDTIILPAVFYHNEIVNYKEEQMVWISPLSGRKLEKFIQEWTRLRNAVYVTYPYARIAGATINDINAQMTGLTTKIERKAYIKSREKELRKQFGDPLTNLSVYQGKVLMKLINRQTGNNCYEILKEYKGGLNARLYQTMAWFVGGNLKQNWDIRDNSFDRQIESFVKEIDGNWYYNPYRR
ncbi:MAG: DUF4294 domain-containing protein [Chitinophagaceae bacterium]|nr:DUF4294 domain-containing protein [Chitinophagaceae bacterium]